jgi:aminoglycoside phosphotransferase (APT) family kinase protein
MDEDFLLERLTEFLTRENKNPTVVFDLKPISGGASRDTWFFTSRDANYQLDLILRRDLPTQMFDQALTRAQEFKLMRLAFSQGVMVPKMHYLCEDVSALGSPFLIMQYISGVSIGTKVVHAPEFAQARKELPEQLAQQLALIHNMNLSSLDFSLPRPPENKSAAQDTIEQMWEILDTLKVNNPVWEWTLRWAQNHLPKAPRTTFIHGDFRLGNVLVDSDGLTAVIDWEFAHVGDPNEELGYICMRDWRFGNGKLHFAGISDRETFLHYYEQYSKTKVDRYAVDWWEIMGNIRWGIICLSQANRHLSGQEPSVELASLGRRSAEMQLEALRLIEQVETA